jgi:hypothetical protein
MYEKRNETFRLLMMLFTFSGFESQCGQEILVSPHPTKTSLGPTQPPVHSVPKPFPGRWAFVLSDITLSISFVDVVHLFYFWGYIWRRTSEFVIHPFFSQTFISESFTSVELLARHWTSNRLSDFILREEATGSPEGNMTSEFYKKVVDPTMLRTNFQNRGL